MTLPSSSFPARMSTPLATPTMTILPTFIPTASPTIKPHYGRLRVHPARRHVRLLMPRTAAAPARPTIMVAYATQQRRAGNDGGKESPDPRDDDGWITHSPSNKFHIPNLPEHERAYLDAHTSDLDFSRRLQQIANRMDQERRAESARVGRQSPDDYIANLNKTTSEQHVKPAAQPSSTPPPQPQATQKIDNMGDASIDNVDSKIAELNRELLHASSASSTAPASSATAPPPPAPALETDGAEVGDVDARIADLNHRLEEAMSASGGKMPSEPEPTGPLSPDELMAGVAEAEALRDRIRLEMNSAVQPGAGVELGTNTEAANMDEKIAGLEQTLSNLRGGSSKETPVGDIADVDDKIAGLEETLSKLQGGSTDATASDDEEMAEVMKKAQMLMEQLTEQSSVDNGDSGPAFKGLENTPGELSAEEKQEAFEALRRRAMESRGGAAVGGGEMEDFNDPYNVTLPERRQGPAGGLEVGDLRETDKEAVMEEKGEGDVPTGDESEYDLFGPSVADKKLLVEEMEMEMKSYTEEAKRLSSKHASRMSLLITRLMAAISE